MLKNRINNLETIIILYLTDELTPNTQLMQWIDGVLSKGEKMEFFHDEFRCPVYVKDVVTIIQVLTSRWMSGTII